MDLAQLLPLLIAALGGGGIAAIIQARTTARKADVEALCAALAAIQAENKRLIERVSKLEAENCQLRAEVAVLRSENAELRRRQG